MWTTCCQLLGFNTALQTTQQSTRGFACISDRHTQDDVLEEMGTQMFLGTHQAFQDVHDSQEVAHHTVYRNLLHPSSTTELRHSFQWSLHRQDKQVRKHT